MHLQKDLVNQPDIIPPPPPPKPHHPRTPKETAEPGYPDQGSVLDRVQHRVLHFAALGAFLQSLAFLHADEGAGDDDEAR